MVLLRRAYIWLLSLALLGYAFFGRGFAYLGFPPFYADAFLFVLAALVLFSNPGWVRLFRLPHVWLLVALMFWGLVRTLPYVTTYGIYAFRDGVIWGYAIFALATGYVIARDGLYWPVCKWYSKWFHRFVLWAPVALGLYWFLGKDLPRFPWGPGGGVPILNPKGGDIAVHLAGVLAYALLVAPAIRRVVGVRLADWLFWGGWLLGVVMISVSVRAAFVTVALSIGVLIFHVSPLRWTKVVSLLFIFLALFALTGIEVDVGLVRKVSFTQLTTNLKSIFGEVEGFSGEGTKRWRLEWWRTIITYTIYGDYFWMGKGYGINLADDDGFQVTTDGSLRSPHNGHLTVLARAGVPGFFLWSIFHITFGLSMLLAYWRHRGRGNTLRAGLYLWVFVYWMAAMANGTFDVYLEGPQGGVWFWNIIGLGLGLLLGEKAKRDDASFLYS